MDRIVLVTKATRLDGLVREHLTLGAARFALESRGQSLRPYEQEDSAYKAALDEIRRALPNDVPISLVLREELPNFLFRDSDLIVACGPDGLFANLAKYVRDQPVLTVNPDTVAGVLMLFTPGTVGPVIKKVQDGTHRIEQLPFIKAKIDDDKVVWGINDIFVGRKDQVSARYELSFGGKKERQSSSGVLIATGIGSTGWIRSVAAMVVGISGNPGKLASLPSVTSSELVFVVREPFPSTTTGTSLVTGRVLPGSPLALCSEMPQGGYIFSDGVVEKAVSWNAGSTVSVSVGERYVRRIVP